MFSTFLDGQLTQKRSTRLAVLLVLLLVQCGVFLLVYETGGIRYVYSHSMYVPIVLAGALFGTSGGLLLGITGGLILGPYMPIDTQSGELQQTGNWLFRMVFFVLIGGLVGALSDRVRRYVGNILWQLGHNPESGFPNRNALVAALSQRSVKARRLYQVQLKNLADLELTLGHAVSNHVLDSLRQLLGETSFGIEFFHTRQDCLTLLVSSPSGETFDQFELQLERIFPALIEYRNIPLMMEFRYSSIDVDGAFDLAEDYVRKAEISLAFGKIGRHQKTHYSPQIESEATTNVEMLGHFKASLGQSSEVFVHYQPKYFLGDRALSGAEVLLRWNSLKWGSVSPAVFVPLVENSQLINELTLFVLQQALDALAAPNGAISANTKLSVNISPVNLINESFYPDVINLIERSGVDPVFLEFEVTETALLDKYELCQKQLKQFAGLGIGIALDDYGTGYSSLRHLAELPLDVIKIDQMFVKNLGQSDTNQKIVSATINLAHKLGCQVVAEGIEDLSTEHMLRDMGCELGQGFHYARPGSLEQFRQLQRSLVHPSH